MVRRSPKRASGASRHLSAAEALMRELEGVEPEELERLSVAAGLPPGQEPNMGSRLPYRMDRSASSPLGAPASQDFDWALVHKPIWDEAAAPLPASRARVRGDAMRDAGLRDGDVVELDLDMEPEDGDIALAEVDGIGRVLRRLRIIGGVQVLCAAHPNVPSIPVEDPSQVTFHGVVIQDPER